MTIARYYDEDKNEPERYEIDEDGKPTIPVRPYLAGVPLRDLTEGDWAALPDHLKANVDASPFYRKTKPPAPKPASKPAAKPASAPEVAAPEPMPEPAADEPTP